MRLKALLPLWMPWIRKRFKVGKNEERQLLSISPRQNGSPAASEQDAAEEVHLRSHQTRFTAEAPHFL